MSFVAKAYLRNDIFCFQNLKMRFGTLSPYPIKLLIKASEVDQELECGKHQTKYKGNDWVRHGLAPMTTTHIVRSLHEEWLI
jgi:hypothetical protein